MKRTLLLAGMALLSLSACHKKPVTGNYYCHYSKETTYEQHICMNDTVRHDDTLKAYTAHEISGELDSKNHTKFEYIYADGTCGSVAPGDDRRQTKETMSCSKL